MFAYLDSGPRRWSPSRPSGTPRPVGLHLEAAANPPQTDKKYDLDGKPIPAEFSLHSLYIYYLFFSYSPYTVPSQTSVVKIPVPPPHIPGFRQSRPLAFFLFYSLIIICLLLFIHIKREKENTVSNMVFLVHTKPNHYIPLGCIICSLQRITPPPCICIFNTKTCLNMSFYWSRAILYFVDVFCMQQYKKTYTTITQLLKIIKIFSCFSCSSFVVQWIWGSRIYKHVSSLINDNTNREEFQSLEADEPVEKMESPLGFRMGISRLTRLSRPNFCVHSFWMLSLSFKWFSLSLMSQSNAIVTPRIEYR